MVDFMSGYYRAEFQGFWGVIQGGPLSPTIFNMVVDAVVHLWISLVAGLVGGKDRCVGKVRHRAAFFYADYGMVSSTEPFFMQGVFGTLTRFFDRLGFRKHFGNKFGILCCSFHTVGTQSEATYEWRITG